MEQLEWYHFIFMLLAGSAAGVVNTLAGSGSVFTLTVLIFAGLPADIANGTNRIGTTVQSFIATGTFYKNGMLPFKQSLHYTIPALVGALIGAVTAAEISGETMELIIGGIMLLLLLITLFKPQQYINTDAIKDKNHWLQYVVFAGIGFYGGFIQAGIGIFLLVALSVASHFSMVEANAVKILTVMLFSLPVLGIFIYNNQVNWPIGLWVAVGQAIGSFLTAKFAVKSTSANIWIKRILILMMLITIFKVFGAIDWVMKLL